MLKKYITLTLLLVALGSYTTHVIAAGPTLRIRAPQSDFDASHDYFLSLIKLALNKSANDGLGDGHTPYLAQISMAPYMVQQRALEELRANRLIDIYWAGTTIERESTLRAIPIPLVKGLLGFRVFAINKNHRKIFDKITTVQALKKLTLCQGAHWPDTDIMLAAGLNVYPAAIYENMFRQVVGDRCDAFPRGIHEGYSEVLARKKYYPELDLYTDTILYYPFPMYFFVNKKNEALALRLQTGLEKAIDDGSFDHLLQTHPVTRHLFPLKNWIHGRYIKLDNPFLPENIDITNQRYWITPP